MRSSGLAAEDAAVTDAAESRSNSPPGHEGPRNSSHSPPQRSLKQYQQAPLGMMGANGAGQFVPDSQHLPFAPEELDQSPSGSFARQTRGPTETTPYSNLYPNAASAPRSQAARSMKRPTTTTRQSMGQHRVGGGPTPQRLSAAALNRKQLASVKSSSGTSTACQRRVTGAESVVTGTTAAGG